MIELLKAFGRGILYIICFPFFVVAIVFFAAIGLLAFIFQIIKSVIFFFTGQKFFPELPEDRELRLRREAEEAKNNPTSALQTQPATPTEPKEVVPSSLIFEETFNEKDFEEEPTPTVAIPPSPQPAPAPVVEEKPVVPEPQVEQTPSPVEEEKLEEIKDDDEPTDGEPVFVGDDSTLEDILNPSNKKPEEEEEVLEEYKPKETDDSLLMDDEEEDPTSGGVDINYDD